MLSSNTEVKKELRMILNDVEIWMLMPTCKEIVGFK